MMLSPETLRRYPLFAGLDEEMLKKIAIISEEKTFEAGAPLFGQGDEAKWLFLVLDGVVSLDIDLDEEGERTENISTLGVGEMVGWSSLVKPYVYTLGGKAAQKSEVAAVDAKKLRGLLDENPAAGYFLLQNLASVIGERLVNLRVQFVSVTS